MMAAPKRIRSGGNGDDDEEWHQHHRMRHRWRQQRQATSWASSLKANPSDGKDSGLEHCSGEVVSGEGECGVSAGEMYRFQKRLDLQQQHHKCKSYRRTLGSSSCWDEVSSIGDGGHPSAKGHSSRSVVQIEGRRWRWSGGISWSAGLHCGGRGGCGRMPNVFLVVALFLLAGFCSRTGCDDTDQFQKSSEYTFWRGFCIW